MNKKDINKKEGTYMKFIPTFKKWRLKQFQFNFLESDIERAIRKNEFLFYYQPEIDLKTGKTVGVEALMRWYHPEKGLIPPMEFIPLLEKTGLIKKLTPFLFSQTMQDLNTLNKLGFKNLFMSVNLSIKQLQDSSLLNVIKTNLKKYKIKPSNYECEITESEAFTDLSADLQVLQKIDKLKLRLSLDDFGSGYASFDYLRALSIHKMKIDREFIATVFDHEKNEIILSSIIELGHKLNLLVLAEGIETKEQEKWLKKQKCDMVQGFYFARPMPLPELITFLKKNK